MNIEQLIFLLDLKFVAIAFVVLLLLVLIVYNFLNIRKLEKQLQEKEHD